MFDFSDQNNFDDHIFKSIPCFAEMNELLHYLYMSFYRRGTRVVDVGCSSGRLLQSLSSLVDNNAQLIGVDVFNFFDVKNNNIKFYHADYQSIKPDLVNNASVVYSIYTLQFVEYHLRKNFINKIYDSLIDGGAFIISEKVHVDNVIVDSLLQTFQLNKKRVNFSDKEILDKEEKLIGHLVRQTKSELESSLYEAGFSSITSVFQHGAFVCYVCIK